MNLINTIIIVSVTVLTKVLGVQVCGKALADMLDLVCDGRGFHWINPDALPTLSKRSANQYISNSEPFQRRGVVTECCRKSCSLGTMESYCAAPAGVVLPNPTNGPIPKELATEIIKSASSKDFPDSLTTAPAPPPTTTRPKPPSAPPPLTTLRPTQLRISSLKQMFSALSQFRNKGRYPGLGGTPFFFVRPVGPRPTRTPVVA